MNLFLLKLFAEGTAGGGASLGKLLNSFQQTLGNWGSIIVSIIGIAMVIVGVYKVAKNLISHGKGQNSWAVAIGLILVGGVLAVAGGWSTLGNLVSTGNATLDKFAEGNPDEAETVLDPFTGQPAGGGA